MDIAELKAAEALRYQAQERVDLTAKKAEEGRPAPMNRKERRAAESRARAAKR